MTKDEQLAITKYDLLYEQRMTRVETTIENLTQTMKEIRQDMREIRIDYRWILGIMLTGFTGLFGLMAHGFHWF